VRGKSVSICARQLGGRVDHSCRISRTD
jgi:hypothetical protein